MAHRQTYLPGPDPILTLEEAYWQVMSTLTEVDDFIHTCTTAGFVTCNQRFKAEDLHRTLTDQTVYIDLMWHSEANEDKFYNNREWVQIIAEETAITLAAIQKVMSLSGTSPRQRQTENYGQPTLPPSGSIP